MYKDIEELINALNVIKRHCQQQCSCDDCSLSDREGSCLVEINNPSNWEIKEKPLIKVLS